MTRRALVLTQESAGHWFRRTLPPHVFAAFPEPAGDQDAAEHDEDAEAARRWRLNGGDWRSFLSVYCAGFLGMITFIA